MSAVLHRVLDHTPPLAVRGEGICLFDEAGKQYIDASGGAAVSCLGHNHPKVVEAIVKQLETLDYAHTAYFTNEASERLAQKLIDLAPPGFGAGAAAFFGSGSEAVEGALKLARQYHVERGDKKRTKFIARRMSYHGNTLGALSVSGHKARREGYEPFLFEAAFVAPCHRYRFQNEAESDQAFVERLEQDLRQTIDALGPDTVCAFIAETVSGATLGASPAAPGYFNMVRRVCDEFGILFIADEVMCGAGRCGTYYAIEDEGVAPDIITIAKGLGAGFQPIGAIVAGETVISAIRAGSGRLAHGHTYMSHPAACAAALAVIEELQSAALLPTVRKRGDYLETLLRARFGKHPHVGDIRGRGLLWALEIVSDRRSKLPFSRAAAMSAAIKSEAQERGLICYPSQGAADGVSGDHVLIAPPYIVADHELEEIVDRLAASIDSVLGAQSKAI